ncbi:MAG: family 1 glycosylhydrolase [Candidatus Eremiobacteraeota bacterium]|nr:family 1 glycosylhydrolase [Candidatus Eremiobacteraeota bacterium]
MRAPALEPTRRPEFGLATSAFQVEGGWRQRGASIWDAACPQGATACASWPDFEAELAMLKWVGAEAFRFSLAWPRLCPDGRQFRAAQLAPYERLVEQLLEAGIRPVPTLYHWDLPLALEGGWKNPDTARHFGDYVEAVLARLSDRVGQWFTLNEPWCSCHLGYETGEHAPFETCRPGVVAQVRHHLLEAHRLAVEAVQAAGCRCGAAMLPIPFVAAGPEHEEAAEQAWREVNDIWFQALHPADFLGLNLYYPSVVEATDGGWRERDWAGPSNSLGWPVDPTFYRPTIEKVLARYGPQSLVISETGWATSDDEQRLRWLEESDLDSLPVETVFFWSLMDNLEWQHGFEPQFGFFSRRGEPKPSADWLRRSWGRAKAERDRKNWRLP